MKFAKIEFPTKEDAAKALSGIMVRGRITGLNDGTFIVPEPALDWLKEEGIPYKVVQRLNQDDVVQTLRTHLTHQV